MLYTIVFCVLLLGVELLSPLRLHILLHFRVIVAPPDETLGGIEGVVGVSYRLPLRWHPNQALAIACECNN